MDKMEVLSAIADIHNRLVEVHVKGDDAIRMADILKACRSVVYHLQQDVRDEAQGEVSSK